MNEREFKQSHLSREKGFVPSFENGGFWELYKDLERQFEDFLTYVPFLDGNEKAYSFKLLNLILSIGGHVDSAFKEMAKYSDFAKDPECKKIVDLVKKSERGEFAIVRITDPIAAFERLYGICGEKILFKRLPQRELIQPFKPRGKVVGSPKWWSTYNEVKHHVAFNLEKANLENTLNALAGAFLLNVRHIPAAIRLFDFGLLRMSWVAKSRGKVAYENFLRKDFMRILKNKELLQNSTFFVETPLFFYNYGKGDS